MDHVGKIVRFFCHVLQLVEDETIELPDQISELGDDVLAYILSKLSPKEAARMCSLSHKWQSLYWKVATNLVFDEGFEKFDTYLLEEARHSNFVKHVNEILELNEAGILEKLRIRCNLDNFLNREIDKWVKFAFSKRVERFDLDLSVRGYALTCELFSRIEGTSCFKSLQELQLKDVDINEELVNFLLSYCTNLEHLTIVDSPSLVSFKVTGCTNSVLRYLELSGCFESVEISDMISLVSLALYGNGYNEKRRVIDLQIENAPSLVDLHIGGGFSVSYFEGSMYHLLTQLSSCLKSLTIKITSHEVFRCHRRFTPIMTSLEKFVLQTMNGYPTTFLVQLTTLIFPSLREFVLQEAWKEWMCADDSDRDVWQSGYLRNFAKEVTISGYYGWGGDVEVASFFLKCGVGLERMIIDPRDQKNLLLGLPQNGNCETDSVRAARSCAHKQLCGRVPPGVELVIL